MTLEFDKTDKVLMAAAKAVEVALEAAIIDMHNQAVELAPVKSGNLKGSLTWTIGGKVGGLNSPGGKQPKGTPKQATAEDGVQATNETDTAYLGTNVEYAPYMEYGTKDVDAQPFLRPAFDARKKYTEEIMRKHFKKAMEEATR